VTLDGFAFENHCILRRYSLQVLATAPYFPHGMFLTGEPNFSLLIEGAPFVGDHVDDDNLLQKGRPLIMRLRHLPRFSVARTLVLILRAGPSHSVLSTFP
jgi:hypothetical protein